MRTGLFEVPPSSRAAVPRGGVAGAARKETVTGSWTGSDSTGAPPQPVGRAATPVAEDAESDIGAGEVEAGESRSAASSARSVVARRNGSPRTSRRGMAARPRAEAAGGGAGGGGRSAADEAGRGLAGARSPVVRAGAAAVGRTKVDDDAEKERQMLELLAKLKEAAKVPDHAVRRVKRLDEIIATLRRNRAEVAANILADEERLAELDRMEASVHERLDPLRREVEKRVVEAEDIRERLKHAETGFAGFIDSTRAGMRLTRVREAEHRKANVTRDLVAERGYATDATSKPHKEVPASVLFKARSLLRSTLG